MLEYETRTSENFRIELDAIRNQVKGKPKHLWWISSIDCELHLISNRISWLQASRAQVWAESRSLLRIITMKRGELRTLAGEFTAEIESLVAVQQEFLDVKHELLTHVNQRLHHGHW